MPQQSRINNVLINLLYLLSWIVFVGSIMMAWASISTGRIPEEWIVNSDTLYLPALFKDFFVSHNDVSGWRLAPNPYFFPDMAIYFTINALSDNIHLNFLVYGALQSFLFMLSLLVLSNQFFGAKKNIHILFLLTGIIFFFLISTGDYYVYTFPLIAATHFGILLIIPVALALVLQIIETKTNLAINVIILSLLSVLAVVSDLFYVVQFLIPAMLGVLYIFLLSAITPKKAILLNISLIGSFLIGMILYKAISRYDNVSLYTQMEPEGIIESGSSFLIWLKDFSSSYPIFSLLWVSFVLAIILLLISSFKSLRTNKQKIQAKFLFIYMFIFLVILINIVIVGLSGNFVDITSTRYFIPVLIIPVFFGWSFLLAGTKISLTILTNRFSMLFLGFILILSLFFSVPQNISAMGKWFNYTPDLVQCLDQKTHEMGMKNGLAHYWQARYISLLSDVNLHIVSVNQELHPYHWINNLNEYDADFEFVLIDEAAQVDYLIDASTVINRFGQPASTFKCGRTTVLVYNRPEDIQFQKQFKGSSYLAKFNDLNDNEFYGVNLPSSSGQIVGLSREANEEKNEAGLLTYGPYVRLPAGDYEFEIHYYSDGENVVIGKWDVAISTDDNIVVIKEGSIIGENQDSNIISETFTLPSEQIVEIRIYYAGRGTLIVDKIKVKKRSHDSRKLVNTLQISDNTMLNVDSHCLEIVSPQNNETEFLGRVDFVWKWACQPLAENQAFEIRIWREGGSFHYGAHDAAESATSIRQVDDIYMMRLDLNGVFSVNSHGEGDYLWTVAAVEIEPTYRDLDIEAQPHYLRIISNEDS